MRIRRAAALPLLVLLLGCPGPDEAPEVDFRVSVTVEEASMGDVEMTLITTGSVRAAREAELTTPGAGQLRLLRNPGTGRRYRDGDTVRRGEILAVVETEETRVSRTSGLEASLQRLKVAEAELDRQKSLHEDGVVSTSALQEARSAVANARYDYENALTVDTLSKVESPIAGVLADVTRSGEGEWVGAGRPVATVLDFDKILVEAQLGAGDLARVAAGQEVRVTTYAYPGRTFPGEIAAVSPSVDPETRTVRIEAQVPNEERLLRPGLFVKVEIVVQKRTDVIAVPKDAVVIRGGGPIIFTVERQKARERKLALGLEGSEKVEVVQGLEEGERIVIEGFETLRDGTSVRVSG